MAIAMTLQMTMVRRRWLRQLRQQQTALLSSFLLIRYIAKSAARGPQYSVSLVCQCLGWLSPLCVAYNRPNISSPSFTKKVGCSLVFGRSFVCVVVSLVSGFGLCLLVCVFLSPFVSFRMCMPSSVGASKLVCSFVLLFFIFTIFLSFFRHRVDIFGICGGGVTAIQIVKQICKVIWIFIAPLLIIGNNGDYDDNNATMTTTFTRQWRHH